MATYTWTFDIADNYIFDAGSIRIENGFAKLRLQTLTGSIDDEPFDDLTAWIIISNATATEISPAGQLHMYDASDVETSYIRQEYGDLPNEYTFELKMKFDQLSTTFEDGTRGFRVMARNGVIGLGIGFAQDGIYVYDGVSYVMISDSSKYIDYEWNDWRFVVRGSDAATASVDIWKNDKKIAPDIFCGYDTTEYDGYFMLQTCGTSTDPSELHIDHLKIDTGIKESYWTQAKVECKNLFQPTAVVSWDSFSEIVSADTIGNVTYTLYKVDKTYEWWWDGTKWSNDGGHINNNSASVINANIKSFDPNPSSIGFRAYLNSDGTQVVELDSVSIGYSEEFINTGTMKYWFQGLPNETIYIKKPGPIDSGAMNYWFRGLPQKDIYTAEKIIRLVVEEVLKLQEVMVKQPTVEKYETVSISEVITRREFEKIRKEILNIIEKITKEIEIPFTEKELFKEILFFKVVEAVETIYVATAIEKIEAKVVEKEIPIKAKVVEKEVVKARVED